MANRLYSDFQKRLPNHRMTTIFDVGSDAGQATEQVLQFFPEGHVYAFGTVQATFDAFKQRFGDHPNVTANRLALGSSCDVGGVSEGRAHLAGSEDERDEGSSDPDAVPMLTGDVFCDQNAISRVSYLKINAQGRSLDVLKGFHRMIGSQLVDAIQVEASMHAQYRKLVPFEVFRGYLEACDYFLFGIYDQAHENKGRPVLRRSSPVFLSRQVVEENTLSDKHSRQARGNADS